MIKRAHNFDVLTVLERHCEVACAKAWVNSAINKGAAKASAKALNGVGELIMGGYI
jgi:hypothetical protein